MSYQNLPSYTNSRFNYAANEVLRTGVPQYNQMSPYPNYSIPPYQYQKPPLGFPPVPHPSFYPGPILPLPLIQLPPENKPDKYQEEDEEEFEMMIKLIDKQRNILGNFVKVLDKNKDNMINDRTKELNKQIKKLEKEGVISQLKLNNEQGRLIRKLNAPYEFDGDQYQLSDASSDEEDDDDILLELLSNKIYFKKIKALLKKKKGLKALLQKRGQKGKQTKNEDDEDNSVEDTLDETIVSQIKGTKKRNKSKKKTKKLDEGDGNNESDI